MQPIARKLTTDQKAVLIQVLVAFARRKTRRNFQSLLRIYYSAPFSGTGL